MSRIQSHIIENKDAAYTLYEGEPMVNVARSLKDEGHNVLRLLPEEMHFRLLVEKNRVKEE